MMKRIGFILALILTPSFAQEVSSHHTCQVFADDLGLVEELARRGSQMTDEERREIKSRLEIELGRFSPKISLANPTTRSFPLPNANRIVTVTVVYIEGFVPRLAKYSMTVAIAISNQAVSNATLEPGAAVAQTDMEVDTFKVIAKQVALVAGKRWLVGADCQLMTDEDRRKQIDSQQSQ